MSPLRSQLWQSIASYISWFKEKKKTAGRPCETHELYSTGQAELLTHCRHQQRSKPYHDKWYMDIIASEK